MEGRRETMRGGLVWGEAIRFAAVPAVLALAAVLWGRPVLGALFLFLALGVAAFFRDPTRRINAPADAILSPADGKVVEVRPDPVADGRVSLAIFLSLFDVHVNRSPVSGGIAAVRRRPGRFFPAYSPRASVENATAEWEIQAEQGSVRLRQIAGAVARRIVCWKRPGEPVARGERIGLIRFGSRVELDLPPTARLCVRPGERVRGGLTVIGRFVAGEEPRA